MDRVTAEKKEHLRALISAYVKAYALWVTDDALAKTLGGGTDPQLRHDRDEAVRTLNRYIAACL